MKLKYPIILTLLISTVAYAAIRVEQRDLKLASQALLEHQTFTAPVIADDNRILNDQATSASASTTATTFLAQPDVCRVLSITPGGTTADVPAGNVIVNGYNANGAAITENFTLVANQSTIANGTKAFCSVTSIVFPVQDGASATYDVGVLDKLGFKNCLNDSGRLFKTLFGGVNESVSPTLTTDVDEVEKNTIAINSALDGATDVEVYFVQNFRCLP